MADDASSEDAQRFMIQISLDAGCHAPFAEFVLQRFAMLTKSYNVESLSHLCQLLQLHESILDVVSLHIKISDLVYYALLLLENYDCETVGDPQTAVSHLGVVVLFLQSILTRFHLESVSYSGDGNTLSAQYLKHADQVYYHDLEGEDLSAFTAWFKALFDSGSEGIEDTILRSTRPKTLLRMAPTLFFRAIQRNMQGKIDLETLTNGVSYFTGPLLNWTLVGVIKVLLSSTPTARAPVYFDILKTLLTSSCPSPILVICGPQILQVLSKARAKEPPVLDSMSLDNIEQLVTEALSLLANAEAKSRRSLAGSSPWQEYPRQAILSTLSAARAGKAPSFDVDRCIKTANPSRFLQLLWSELVVSAALGEQDTCKQLALFVLTIPRKVGKESPPLLPLFVYTVVPSLLVGIDGLQQPEQAISLDLLAAILSSALTVGLHLEVSLRSTSVLGQPCTQIARTFVARLRTSSHPISRQLLHRLSSSQAFAAFKSELS